MKYRKKMIVEAEQLTWNNWSRICEFVPREIFKGGIYIDDITHRPMLNGLTSNTMGMYIMVNGKKILAIQGDYIVRRGSLYYVCRQKIFEEIYERMGDETCGCQMD